MSDKSDIEWTDATWNPVRGCEKVSPGCKHCYAVTRLARMVLRIDRDLRGQLDVIGERLFMETAYDHSRAAVVLDGFAAQFVALAAQPASPERDAAARALATEIQAPKYEKIGGYWGFMDLGCDAALITLGLAEEIPNRPGRAGRYILPAYTKKAA